MANQVRSQINPQLPQFKGVRALTQIAIITTNTEKMTQLLSQHLGLGSFKIFSAQAPQLFNGRYKGKAEAWSMKAGLTWLGDTQIEVIQPTSAHTVYGDYLNARQQQAGIEHIYLDVTDFEATRQNWEALGYPLAQEAQLNAAGRVGILPVPALPNFLKHLSTRFGYTSTQQDLKLDLEIAKFPKGVSQRFALKAAIAEAWIPANKPHYFENLPDQAPLSGIHSFYLLCKDIHKTAAKYAQLTNHPPKPVPYTEQDLPGTGLWAKIAVGKQLFILVQPQTGRLKAVLEQRGEGLSVLGVQAKTNLTAAERQLQTLGWRCQLGGKGKLLATHAEIPFELLLS